MVQIISHLEQKAIKPFTIIFKRQHKKHFKYSFVNTHQERNLFKNTISNVIKSYIVINITIYQII